MKTTTADLRRRLDTAGISVTESPNQDFPHLGYLVTISGIPIGPLKQLDEAIEVALGVKAERPHAQLGLREVRGKVPEGEGVF